MTVIECLVTSLKHDELNLRAPGLPWSAVSSHEDGYVFDPDEAWRTYTFGVEPLAVPKWTENADRCLVIAVLGLVGPELPGSIVFHASPEAFRGDRKYFLNRYSKILGEFTALCEPESCTSVVAGGVRYPLFADWEETGHFWGVLDHGCDFNMTRTIVAKNKKAGLPTMVLPPKHPNADKTHVFVDTPNERVLVLETGVPGAPQQPTLSPVAMKTYKP